MWKREECGAAPTRYVPSPARATYDAPGTHCSPRRLCENWDMTTRALSILALLFTGCITVVAPAADSADAGHESAGTAGQPAKRASVARHVDVDAGAGELTVDASSEPDATVQLEPDASVESDASVDAAMSDPTVPEIGTRKGLPPTHMIRCDDGNNFYRVTFWSGDGWAIDCSATDPSTGKLVVGHSEAWDQGGSNPGIGACHTFYADGFTGRAFWTAGIPGAAGTTCRIADRAVDGTLSNEEPFADGACAFCGFGLACAWPEGDGGMP